MVKAILAKALWVGRALVFCVGLAVVSNLVAIALAGTGVGDPFHLGRTNAVDRSSKLRGNVRGSNLVIESKGSGSALDLRVGDPDDVPADKTDAPLKVDSQKKVRNFNADEVDGREPGPQGYAFVPHGTTPEFENSTGVLDVVWATDRYCFDLTFKPDVAVGSAFFTNAAIVSTVVRRADPDDNTFINQCPIGFRDAAARVYDTSGTSRNDVSFSIMFE